MAFSYPLPDTMKRADGSARFAYVALLMLNDNYAYHIVTGSGTNASAVLDGFVITVGQANLNYTYFPNDSGGEMYNRGAARPS